MIMLPSSVTAAAPATKSCAYCAYSTHSKDELVERFKDVHVASGLLWIDLMDGNASILNIHG